MAEETLEQKLRAMRDEFRLGLIKRWEDIDAAWDAACGGDQDAQDTLHRLAHSLAGSGATFGLESVSDSARALERAVEAVHEVEDIAASGAITARLAALKAVMSEAGERRHAGDEVPSPLNLHRDADERRLVYLIEDDKQFADNLALQIGHFGYQVEIFYELKDVEIAVAREQPTAIIADIVFPEGRLAGIETVERFHQHYGEKFPIVFMSTRDDIEARLLSVRAGGTAYFTKPLDVTPLIDTLDELTSSEPKDPYRVLVVDDEPTMTMFYATVLGTAGMEVATLNDPLAVLSEIADFQPEIILLDLYMPGCSGLELASMIRQQEAFVSMPIVYLSAESDRERQLKAMSVGGDEFLTKPIQPEHLISAISSRVDRWRTLRSFMVRDSLTGLLNHTRTNEELDIEVARAVRKKSGLIYAMIDIDLFKNVNDTYGHPTGDRVIKGLARLLQQRLRKVDIIGRVGGEEFAVILVDTDALNAERIMNEMREHFAEILFLSDGEEFTVTFSCGVADFSDYDSAQALREAADKALYQAKKGGRDRVAVASG